MTEFRLPPALEKGDKVAIIGTSGGVQEFPEVLEKGAERLKNRFGLDPVIYDTAEKDTEYLNNHHKEKAEEFMEAFENPEIKGVIALTGGDQQLRMLKYLEPERLKNNPTRFYGISDNTNLHVYLWNLGIQSFYSGQILDDLLAEGEIGEYTYKYLEKAFFQDQIGVVEPAEQFTDDYLDLFQDEITDDRKRYDDSGWDFWNFDGEKVEGRVWGGCFEIIYWLMASDTHMPDLEELEGGILALETDEEYPSENEVKRWLMCMGERGMLQKFSAIIVGRPMRSPLFGEDKSLEEKQEYNEDQKQAIKEEINNYCPETPVIFDFDFGHTHPKLPLPMGGKIELNPEKESVLFR